jgi:vancomycin permeability regulator SanA
MNGMLEPVPESPDERPTTPRRNWFRRLIILALQAMVAGTAVMVSILLWIHAGAAGHMYSVSAVPAAPVALVLGAQVDPDGSPSHFLEARLELARQLYTTGKVRVILASGDNMNHGYDEPTAMKRWLVGHGVPEQKVVLDYAGFDTYDSCDRAVRIFGVTRAIVVTQTYHLPRAVMLCRRLGMDADGVGDETVKQFRGPWLSSSSREYGACVKAVFDVASGRDPVFLGPHETGVDDALRTS